MIGILTDFDISLR